MSSNSAPHRRALSNIGGTLSSRGDPELVACFERAWMRAREESADELTHGFHTYPARMHPALANEILGSLAHPQARVLDPFCGSGTTSTVARAWNRRSATIEFSEGNAASAWQRIVEVGMVRKGASQGVSTAIAPKRRTLEIPAPAAESPADGADGVKSPTRTASRRRRAAKA